ncbi:hypothetical protein JCM15457_2404 [Liquorilactobacillus sucicola DSM 21376 = JCM 15457]|uniref:Transcriptional regulator n=1 Tax=Liquorilactobacillus sucicola DSM 21376 = JCM 15457 TaxID=1423806 RepID=A0A023D0W6_9LACO|nr:YutD family protein [Liquorilactobacillus sucicola]KRN06451.1 hypothetical protein FD15_GL001072 [Liquorilactobacillus sucicola DSM 21376 = JCM 15457]GAJ27415.1 hypothetical protein JCM15457_2404 [Liquorilactobacillus sucicola DSM 21376 = JCM 15457]
MNSEKKERREAQLAKKAETLKAYASDIQMKNSTELTIDGHPYILVKNVRDGFQIEKLKERFSQILTKYDYIVGDWGYDQLRLHGFYAADSNKGFPSQNIAHLDDYLYEYCNFGCAYFILHNLDVQKVTRSANDKKHGRKRNSTKHSEKNKSFTKKSSKRSTKKQHAFVEEKRFDIHKKRDKKQGLKSRSVHSKNTKKRHFTIRQKSKNE